MICRPILRGEPLTVRVQGLEYMNDDPSSVDVLYAKIQAGEQAEKSVPILNSLYDILICMVVNLSETYFFFLFYFLGFKYLLID